jgi:hypothetical protein
LFNCAASDTACWNKQSVDDILDAQDNLSNAAMTLDLSTGVGEPIRLVRDGSLITSPMDSTAPFPSVSKPIIVSNVKNEAGLSIFGGVPAITTESYIQVVNGSFGAGPTAKILANPNYAALNGTADEDQRPVLEKLGTDQIWRCPGWTFARNWVHGGGKAFVGLYVVGASYPGNIQTTSFCGESGVVCHQDDIEIVVCVYCYCVLHDPISQYHFSLAPRPTPIASNLRSSLRCKLDTGLSLTLETLMPSVSLTGSLLLLLTFMP